MKLAEFINMINNGNDSSAVSFSLINTLLFATSEEDVTHIDNDFLEGFEELSLTISSKFHIKNRLLEDISRAKSISWFLSKR